ncbi:MAG TPA: TonB-dependent receptor plug domain-containing protein, partial [Arachidicoccus sp.]
MKKYLFHSGMQNKKSKFKILHYVKLSCFILLVTCLQVSAKGFSQRLTLMLKNVSYSQAFSTIEQKTSFRIIFSDDLLPETTVSVNAHNESLTDIMNEILEGTNLTYRILDNKVIVVSRSDSKFQAKTISGTVSDSSGNLLSGVSVQIKGTTKGTLTNALGAYTLDVPDNAILVFAYVGYQSQEISLGANTTIDVRLLPSEATASTDVVVTALGVKRSEKDLTYSTQQIAGDQLTTVKNTNLINSLNGKVAGLTINANGSGVGGSAKVVLRGNKSLLGNNQALYVIDGVPMNNTVSNQPNSAFGGSMSYDGGDPISNLNPDDIQSITVLKGASASALYGGAGANGVILITTKSGQTGRTQINFSSGASLSSAAYKPKFQNTYGQEAAGSTESWGNDTTAANNDVSSFFQTGNNFTNSVSLSSGSAVAQSYFSYANTTARGIEPGNKLERNNFNFREIGHFLNNKLTVDVNTNYVTQKIDNTPNAGYYFNPLTGLYLFPRG